MSVARVVTPSATRYGRQLCEHFAHKVSAQWQGVAGEADLPGGQFTAQASDMELLLRIDSNDEEGMARAQFIVTDHLQRFSRRDPLNIQWEKPDARA